MYQIFNPILFSGWTMDFKLSLFLFAAFFLHPHAEGARILGLFPVPGKSHMIVFSALTKALAERGHELVVVSTFPIKNPPANYTDVNIWDSLKEIYVKMVDENLYDFADMPPFLIPLLYWIEGVHIIELTLQNPKVMDLLKDKRGFDLVIAEDFMSEAIFGFAQHFKVGHENHPHKNKITVGLVEDKVISKYSSCFLQHVFFIEGANYFE